MTAFGGIAALVIGAALLLEDASAVFVPVLGMVGGIAVMALANHERLKQRIEILEKRGASGVARRDQLRRVNSNSETITGTDCWTLNERSLSYHSR